MSALRGVRRRCGCVLGAAMLVAALLPSRTAAHETLTSSSPAADATLTAIPRELRLTFSSPVKLALFRVGLDGPAGAVELGAAELHTDSSRVVLVPVRQLTAAGTYTVRWQVAGPDGHPVRGEFSFVITEGAIGLALPPAPGAEAPPVEHHPVQIFPDNAFNAESPLYVAIRWLTFIGLLGVLGAMAFRLVLLLMARQRLPACAALSEPATDRTARLGAWMVALVLVAAFLRLIAQSYALHGGTEVWNPALLGTLIADTIWGWGWLVQLGGAMLALAGFLLVRSNRATGWIVAGAGALLLAMSPGLSGHAVSAERFGVIPVITDTAHVIGAGGWLGSLLVMLVVGIPSAMHMDKRDRPQAVAALVNAFSPTALFFAGLTVATGVFAAWLHIGVISGLWESAYGRILLVKLGVLTGVFATGAYNWLRVRPALGNDAATSRLRRSATFEIAIAIIVLVVTAVLVATPPPMDGMDM